MKTKFVTSYYAYHYGPPFWGHINRERWYKYSLISLCNMGEEIICYTDEGNLGYNQLVEIKETHNLQNLQIKIFKLVDNLWQNKIYEIATNGKNEYYKDANDYRYHISPQIYWLKWYFLKKEFEPDINLYWIDCGLSHPGLFPKMTNPYSELEGYNTSFPNEHGPSVEFRYYQFTKAFTPEFVKRVNEFHNGKIVNLCKTDGVNYNFGVFLDKLKLESASVTNYPIGGFWGGNSNLIPQYAELYFNVIDKVLQVDDYLIADQEIMCYLNANYPHLFKNWSFRTFCHEDWSEQNLFDPSWEISLSWFFTKNLQ